jgi:DNA-binding transcriptional ArsR family regulator
MDASSLTSNLAELEVQAEQAARLMAALANAKRLIVLCNLLEGERTVGDLAAIAGLSQAALSQHLGRLRDQKIVATRRDGQLIYYRLANPDVLQLMDTLSKIYCKAQR